MRAKTLSTRSLVLAGATAVAVALAGCSGQSEGIVTQAPETPNSVASSASSPGASPSPSAAPTVLTEEATKSDSVCGLDGVEMTGTVLEPFDVSELYVGAFPLWSSPEYGPAAQDPSGFYYCFQHSPEGAVLAAMAFSIQGAALVDDAFYAFNDYVAGPGPDANTPDIERDMEGKKEALVELRATPLGVRVLQYDGERAWIDVAIERSFQGTITQQAGMLPLVWSDGDWKIEADGSKASSGAVSSLDGYVLFTPTNNAQ